MLERGRVSWAGGASAAKALSTGGIGTCLLPTSQSKRNEREREREADPIYVIIIQIIDSFSFVHVHKKTKPYTPGSREEMISLKTPNE